MKNRFLMCAPRHFEVAYVINPWMEGNVAHGSNAAAIRQWNALLRLMRRFADVDCMTAAPGVPDLVFTANAGLILSGSCVLSRFRHPERRLEEPHFAKWFASHGFALRRLPEGMDFEGAGDALLDRRLPLLWMGHGHRTDFAAAGAIAQMLDIEVQPLELVDPRFYHLDTCFCPLENGALLYYLAAFDAASQQRIAALVPAELRIAVGDEDARDFACNAVNIGSHIILNRASDTLVQALAAHGYLVHQTPLSEFMKAGGSAKCLTLKLDEARMPALALSEP
jgi:N-dimethylarginine dimethylaminohydrolase